MAQESLKNINQSEPSTLARIVMEIECLNEDEKLAMLRQVRMKKALFMAEKLKSSIKPNKISLADIVAEQKQMHKEKGKHDSKVIL
ncbi:MAG: hypothetical protein ABIR50_10500 [Ginsengibacter sp.]